MRKGVKIFLWIFSVILLFVVIITIIWAAIIPNLGTSVDYNYMAESSCRVALKDLSFGIKNYTCIKENDEISAHLVRGSTWYDLEKMVIDVYDQKGKKMHAEIIKENILSANEERVYTLSGDYRNAKEIFVFPFVSWGDSDIKDCGNYSSSFVIESCEN